MIRLWAISLVVLTLETTAGTNVIRGKGTRLSKLDHAVLLAVEIEVRADRLEDRRDLCLAFGHGLTLDEKGILSELRRRGLRLRADGWCNEGLRGSIVSIVAPVQESPKGTYEVVVELGDLRGIKESGAHFGTLVRRGTYSVCSDGGGEPELVGYRKSCCPKSRIAPP